ncbi:MAG TPA: glycosyltransferase family 4 protein [Thermoplasmata archaeon]|nr:glycosyltransferase family 4 protein [Thermoplasmata archaeon]
MNVAQLSMRYPPGPGGVERHVAEIAPRLVAKGHRVTVYTSDLYSEFPLVRLDPTVPRDERHNGLRVRRLKVLSLPSELHYPFFRGLGPALRNDPPDLLHVHTYGTHHAAVARRFARRRGVPWVMTAHFHPIWSIHGGWLRHRIRGLYDRRLAGPIVRDAARLIVQSREEERLMQELGIPLPPTVIVPPGFAPLPPPLDAPDGFGRTIGVDGPFVLFVGRLASNKGLLALVQAFAEVRSHDPSAHLVLVGEDGGMAAPVVAEAQRLGIAGAVHLTGFLKDERLLASAFREARLFALPSEYEAFGLVLLESLAHGTPVVASRVGGIPEFIEDGRAGLLVAPQDAGEIARAFMKLWDNAPRRRELGDYGRTQVVPRFSWDTLVERLDQLYAEVRTG